MIQEQLGSALVWGLSTSAAVPPTGQPAADKLHTIAIDAKAHVKATHTHTTDPKATHPRQAHIHPKPWHAGHPGQPWHSWQM